jgi:hypothetical protein
MSDKKPTPPQFFMIYAVLRDEAHREVIDKSIDARLAKQKRGMAPHLELALGNAVPDDKGTVACLSLARQTTQSPDMLMVQVLVDPDIDAWHDEAAILVEFQRLWNDTVVGFPELEGLKFECWRPEGIQSVLVMNLAHVLGEKIGGGSGGGLGGLLEALAKAGRKSSRGGQSAKATNEVN